MKTETGSVYEFNDDLTKVRRVQYTHDLRRDGEWLELRGLTMPHIGASMVLELEPLGEGDVTYRRTSWVTEIEYEC